MCIRFTRRGRCRDGRDGFVQSPSGTAYHPPPQRHRPCRPDGSLPSHPQPCGCWASRLGRHHWKGIPWAPCLIAKAISGPQALPGVWRCVNVMMRLPIDSPSFGVGQVRGAVEPNLGSCSFRILVPDVAPLDACGQLLALALCAAGLQTEMKSSSGTGWRP